MKPDAGSFKNYLNWRDWLASNLNTQGSQNGDAPFLLLGTFIFIRATETPEVFLMSDLSGLSRKTFNDKNLDRHPVQIDMSTLIGRLSCAEVGQGLGLLSLLEFQASRRGGGTMGAQRYPPDGFACPYTLQVPFCAYMYVYVSARHPEKGDYSPPCSCSCSWANNTAER